MVYDQPILSADDEAVLAELDALRDELRYFLRDQRRWYGSLRRATLARAMQGSNSIEGYHASVEDVAAVMEHEEPLDADEETRQAIAGYRDAMTYVLQLAAGDTMPAIDESLLRSMHFMLMKYDLGKHPGHWRPGAIWVENQDGDVVYNAPDRDLVPVLVDEMLRSINESEGHPMVRAAMAHLNLTLVHPFTDGNGRMARCLQSFVLASDDFVGPEFLSIEEYLGRNTPAYYAVLTEVAGGSWSPQRSTLPWIRFCLTAHHRQAVTLLRRIREMEALWDRCQRLVRDSRLPDRTVGALVDSARGWRLHRSLYVKLVKSTMGEQISPDTASRDLRALADAGLLEPVGEKRGRTYVPREPLLKVRAEIRALRPQRSTDDPYERVARGLPAPKLPGI
jgi:Fic family protein